MDKLGAERDYPLSTHLKSFSSLAGMTALGQLGSIAPKAATRTTAVGMPDKSRWRRLAIPDFGKALPHAMIGFGRSWKLIARNARRWHSTGMARVRVSIVFDSGARIGPGKAKLLESIRDTGSISAAARDMGISYKRAWVLLDSINRAFTEPVVTAAPGGAGGGGAILTAFGAEVLERYNRILDRAATNAGDDLTALTRRARPDAGPKV